VDANAVRRQSARPIRRILCTAAAALLAALACTASHAQATTSGSIPVAHGTIAASAPVTYDNRWELYGGLSYMNSTAGPDFIPRMNMGGGELMGTRWLQTNHPFLRPGRIGLALDVRGEYGTTPVWPNGPQYGLHRVLVFQNMAMGGLQMRGPKNQFFALNIHVLGGASRGDFSHGTEPAAQPQVVGLYTNRWAPIGAIGTSLDINLQKKIAVRLQPDLMLSHWGDATDTNAAFSMGLIYRFGK